MSSRPSGDVPTLNLRGRQAVIDLRERVGGRSLLTAEAPPAEPFLTQVRRRPPSLPPWYRRWHIRIIDIVGASIGLVVLAPVMALIVVAVRLTTPGPAVFRQRRVGRRGQEFDCYKFRSMYEDSADRLTIMLAHPAFRAEWGDNRKFRDDPRITSVGRFLRRWDLDELPQLWNVLTGSMSLVGPRPVPADETELYGFDLRTVLSVRPGMTGLWQVSGRNDLPYSRRVALDVLYVERQSLTYNLRLITRTFKLARRDRSHAR